MAGAVPAGAGARCEAAARRGAEWLAAQWRDGRMPLDSFGRFFKAPYALAACGLHNAADEIVDACVAAFRESDAKFVDQFAATPTKGRPTGEHTFAGLMQWYPSAVFLYGCAVLGRWDVASPAAAAELTAAQMPCGGWGDGEVALSCPTAMVSILLLRMGHVAPAQKAADLLVSMWEAQPHAAAAPGRLYVAADAAGKLVTEPKGDLAWLGDGREVLWCVDASRERQHNYEPGVQAVLLGEMYLVKRDERYLNAALGLLRFDAELCSKTWIRRWASKCKVAWGGAVVLRGCALAGRTDCAWLRAHTWDVAESCFLGVQEHCGDFGDYHFPIHDKACTAAALRGKPKWGHDEDACAAAGVVAGEHFFVGTNHELTAEFCYELCAVARGIHVTGKDGRENGAPAKRARHE